MYRATVIGLAVAAATFCACPAWAGDGDDTSVLVVNVPRDAALFINGKRVGRSAPVREYETKLLERGYIYHYTVEGEVYRNGQRYTDSVDVKVRPGKEYEVTLDLPTEATARSYVPSGGDFTPGGSGMVSQPRFTSGGSGMVSQPSFNAGGSGMVSQPNFTSGGGPTAPPGFSGGSGLFTSGGMGGSSRGDFTPGAGGNTGPGSYALINGQKVYIPPGSHLNQMGGPSGGFGNRPSGNFGSHHH